MSTLSTSVDSSKPLWERTHDVYIAARTQLERSPPPGAVELDALSADIERVTQELLTALKQPLESVFHLGDLAVSMTGGMQAEEMDFLAVGDVRLMGDRFRSSGHRPLALLFLEVRPETDEWLVVPYGPSFHVVRDFEWETGTGAPLLDVLCFWNARWVQGAVLEDGVRIDEVPPEEMDALKDLYAAMKAGRSWPEPDLARSGPPIISVIDERHDYVDQEAELMRELTLVKGFRSPMDADVGSLMISDGGGMVNYRQVYKLVGFARELRLNTLMGGRVEVTLSEVLSPHGAALHQPVLATGSGSEYPLRENDTIVVPLEEIEQGFTVRMGEYGPATLTAAGS